MNTYQLSEVQLRERHVLRPDHHRDEEVPQHPGIDRDEEQEQHDRAVGGERLVVLVERRGSPRSGVSRLSRTSPAAIAADDEEDRHDDQVQDADPLVVDREQPRQHAVRRRSGSCCGSAGVRLGRDRRRRDPRRRSRVIDGRSSTSFLSPSARCRLGFGVSSPGRRPGPGTVRSGRGRSPGFSDLMYATRLQQFDPRSPGPR